VVTAVDNVSLNIKQGEMVGYLGPNGAGKSTTIKMMTGVLEPTRGEIYVNGKIPYKNRTKNAQNIGVVFGQRTQLWWDLPLIESFKILKEIYRIDGKVYKSNLELFDSLVNVSELYQKTVRQMSLGQRTLCDILASFLHNPGVVFLDEPTIGLDVSMKSRIRKLIHMLNKEKGTTVILTTHDMGDVDALCNRIIIIDKGKAIYDNSIENLKHYFGNHRTVKLLLNNEISQEDDMNLLCKQLETYLLKEFPFAKSIAITHLDKWITLLMSEDEVSVLQILQKIQEKYHIYDMVVENMTTESVLMKIYEGGIQ
jgi:ABC-2 type transport system ATP-binding protein